MRPKPRLSMTMPQARRGEVTVTLPLTPQETTVLSTLMMLAPMPVPMSVLVDALWGLEPDGGPDDAPGHVNVLMSRLRGKLPGVIERVAGLGWTIPHA